MSAAADSGRVLFVLTTVSTDAEARAIAERLVNERLAACVNAIPGLRSLYRWKGAVEESREILLLVKTLESRYEDVARAIREIHPYELPEIVALGADRVEETFARWIADSCGDGTPLAEAP